MAALVPDLQKVEIAVVEMTNTARVQAKLGAVTVSPQLTAAARAYAALLATSGKFLHDADGSPASRAAKAGYQACAMSENLALRRDGHGFETIALAKSAVDGWLASPQHRRNVMNGAMREAGVGVALMPDQSPKYVVVQMLGQPGAIGFKVRNEAAGPAGFAFAGKKHTLAPHTTLSLKTCSAEPVVFVTPDPKAANARYIAKDGATFVLSGTAGNIKVEVQPKR